MDSIKYLNPYPDDLNKCVPLYVTKDGKLQDDILFQIKSVEEKFAKEIDRTICMFKPNGDYSIYTGYCGTALLYFLKFKKTNDHTYLTKALQLADNAVANLKNKRISFLNGDSGPLALSIVLHKHIGDVKTSDSLIQRLLEVDFKNSSHPDEILYGRAGYLYSLLFVDKHYGKVIPLEFFRKVIYYIIKSGWRRAKNLNLKVPLSYEWHDKNYLGAAHGIAGILHTLLCAHEMLSEDEQNVIIPQTLRWLARKKYSSNNFLSSEGSNKDKLVQWCHGSPGFVHLFLRAYTVYGKQEYLELAIEAGKVVWERGLVEKGYSICHGVAGNAYCFLTLYKTTKDLSYLYKAACFADWCTEHPKHQGLAPDRPYSLYEGIAGIDYFLVDIQDAENSAFPGYDL